MDLRDRIRELAKKKGLSLPKLEEELGFGNGTIVKWDKAKPNIDKLKKVADYLDVSIDYLVDGKEIEDSDPDIQLIRRASKKMNIKQKEKMMELLKISFEELFDDEMEDKER
jgi:transcriptional regulator with XRE-family HTH domain